MADSGRSTTWVAAALGHRASRRCLAHQLGAVAVEQNHRVRVQEQEGTSSLIRGSRIVDQPTRPDPARPPADAWAQRSRRCARGGGVPPVAASPVWRASSRVAESTASVGRGRDAVPAGSASVISADAVGVVVRCQQTHRSPSPDSHQMPRGRISLPRHHDRRGFLPVSRSQNSHWPRTTNTGSGQLSLVLAVMTSTQARKLTTAWGRWCLRGPCIMILIWHGRAGVDHVRG